MASANGKVASHVKIVAFENITSATVHEFTHSVMSVKKFRVQPELKFIIEPYAFTSGKC